ncbi:MAG: 3'-5' exonuclease [Gemmatimonadota bacterium]|nr:3'-5' exonuclease [Gemmatimonadota bacterium]
MELHTLPYVVVDVETTGGRPGTGDRVTEVAAVQVEQGRIALLYHSLVNPERPIPPYVARLTGISDAMVREAPTFAEIAGELAAHLAGRIFVAHNARFDLGFLGAEFARVAPTPLDELLGGSLCTVRLARRVLGHLPRRNLDAVCHHYGVRIADRHRAAGDAEATAHVLVHLMEDLARQGIHTWEELDRWLSRGTSRSPRARAIPVASDGAEGA